jgi:hypothetical protein
MLDREIRTLGFSSCTGRRLIRNCDIDWCCNWYCSGSESSLNKSGLQFAQLPHEPFPTCKSAEGDGQAHPVKHTWPHRGRGGDGRAARYLVARPPPAPLRLEPAGGSLIDRLHGALRQHERRAQAGHGDRQILSAIAHLLFIPILHLRRPAFARWNRKIL